MISCSKFMCANERATVSYLSPGFEASRQIEATSRPRRGCVEASVEASIEAASRLCPGCVEAIEADPTCD